MNGYNFTDRVRKVLQMAREEAARLHHEYVGTEHILLGLIREGEGVAAAVLQNLNVDLEEIQQKIEETVKKGKAAAAAGPDRGARRAAGTAASVRRARDASNRRSSGSDMRRSQLGCRSGGTPGRLMGSRSPARSSRERPTSRAGVAHRNAVTAAASASESAASAVCTCTVAVRTSSRENSSLYWLHAHAPPPTKAASSKNRISLPNHPPPRRTSLRLIRSVARGSVALEIG